MKIVSDPRKIPAPAPQLEPDYLTSEEEVLRKTIEGVDINFIELGEEGEDRQQ